MALYGDLTYDSRVIREAEALASAGHAVTIVCLAASDATISRLGATVRVVVSEPPGATAAIGAPSPFLAVGTSSIRVALGRGVWLWRFERSLAQWGRKATAAVGQVDVWHAHDLTGLHAIAPNVPRAVPIVYDSHELFLESGSAARLPWVIRRLLRAHEARLVKRCSAMITVNPGLAEELRRRYRPARIEVVRNCPPRWLGQATKQDLIRTTLGLEREASILLFHGALERDRGIEQLIAVLATDGLEDLHLVLLGYGEYRDALVDRSSDPDVSGRLHVLPAVAPAELSNWVASADLGAVLQQPSNQNLVLSTPNKLYESIAVGTPVIASNLPEIARIVRDDPDGPLGILCDPTDQNEIAAVLRSLLGPSRTSLRTMHENCLRTAQLRLNWEMEARKLVDLYAAVPAS